MPHSTNEHSKHKLHHLANCYYCHRYDIIVLEFERCIGGPNYSSIGQKQKHKNLRVLRKGCIFPGREEGKSIYGLPVLSLYLFSKSLAPHPSATSLLSNCRCIQASLSAGVGPPGCGNCSRSRDSLPAGSPALTPNSLSLLLRG